MNSAVSTDLVRSCGSVPTGSSSLHQQSPQHISEEFVRVIEEIVKSLNGEETFRGPRTAPVSNWSGGIVIYAFPVLQRYGIYDFGFTIRSVVDMTRKLGLS